MIKTTYQTPELRDANDEVVQEGAFGKNTALSNSTNDGWIDYVMNDLEALHDTVGDSSPTLDGNGHVVEPANLAIGDEDGVRLKTGYLKTSGGTVSGTLNIAQNLKMQDNQENVFGGMYVPASSATSQFLQIYGGEAPSSNGGNLQLLGNGQFTLQSKNGNTAYNLVGGTDGTLKWRGNSVAVTASPAFTGTPTAPTPTATDNSTKIATTAWVQNASAIMKMLPPNVTGSVENDTVEFWKSKGNCVAYFDTLGMLKDQPHQFVFIISVTIQNEVHQELWSQNAPYAHFYRKGNVQMPRFGNWIGVAPLASPAFSGTPTAPTPAATDNSTKLATTEYVTSKMSQILPTTGGTMTGLVTFNKNGEVITGAGTDKQITYGSASPVQKGAHLVLNGGERSADPGYFTLIARNLEQYSSLQGTPDGVLKWNNKYVAVKDDIQTAMSVLGASYKAEWTATETSANNTQLTGDIVNVPVGVYIMELKLPAVSTSAIYTSVKITGGQYISPEGFGELRSRNCATRVIKIVNPTNSVVAVAAQSAAVTFSYLERGGLSLTRIG